MFHHSPAKLQRQPARSFLLTREDGPSWAFRPDDGGWRIEASEGGERWELRRHDEPGGGFLLRKTGSEEELGRTSAIETAGQARELRYLLLGDGRLFHVALRGPGDCRFELTGWETGGAYLTARPLPDGWRFEPTPASGGLGDLGTLSILLAAEIIDADETSPFAEPV